METNFAQYHCNDGAPYTPPVKRGIIMVETLSFLNGTKLDDVAMSWIDSLRPSSIRIRRIGDSCTKNVRSWRVTILVDQNDVIQEIGQEIGVGLYGEMQHGNDLQDSTDKKILDEHKPTGIGGTEFGADLDNTHSESASIPVQPKE